MHSCVILRVLGLSGLPGPQGWPGRPGSCDINQCQDLIRNVKMTHFTVKDKNAERKHRRAERKRKKKEKRERRRKKKEEMVRNNLQPN